MGISFEAREFEVETSDSGQNRAQCSSGEIELSLHLSALNANHFLQAMRHTVWVGSHVVVVTVHHGVPLRHFGANDGNTKLMLEFMFNGFHRRDFSSNAMCDQSSYDQRRFFVEFTEPKPTAALGEFLWDRYISVVPPSSRGPHVDVLLLCPLVCCLRESA
uniref:Uncharacterized protein n=1 Tax=Leersia perrieri TaxID=77586 RepID=A0A0D9VGC9_9ORYZ